MSLPRDFEYLRSAESSSYTGIELMRFFRAISAMLVLAATAHADTVLLYFTALPATLENSAYGSSNATYNGYSTATIAGVANESVICDDFTHTTYMPSSSNLVYDYSTLEGPDPLQNVRFTGSNATTNYEEAAVLLVGLSTYIAGGHATGNGITDYQYALWNIFDSSLTINTNQQNLQTSALDIVNMGGQTALNDYKQLVIYTPTANYATNQEFLGLNTPAGAPEPGFTLLLALLLGSTWFFVRRRNTPRLP